MDNPGINQRALLELFATVEERRGEWEYSILVSVLEIYNECVRDLLASDHTEKKEVKQGPTGIFIPGLTQVQVSHLEEVNEVRACRAHNNIQSPDYFLSSSKCIWTDLRLSNHYITYTFIIVRLGVCMKWNGKK